MDPWEQKNLVTTPQDIEDKLQELIGCSIERSDNVGRSHEVKKMIGRVLGYNVDAGIRSAAWKSIKPYTFYPHKLVVMVNKHPNLQIWGEDLPPTCDNFCLVLYNDTNCIRKITVLTVGDVLSWDNTGTRTIKHQANITASVRRSATNTVLDFIGHHGLKNQLESILGENIPNITERNKGEWFCQKVAGCFDIQFEENGQFPDIVWEQYAIECKIQKSNVVDLGQYHPESNNILEDGYAPSSVVYCLGLQEDNFLSGIVLCYGRDLQNNGITIIQSVHGKLQMSIPQQYYW